MPTSNHFFSKCFAYARLMRLHRPIGIYLLLWPTLWALWIAGHGSPQLHLVMVFIIGVILMRSAGCVINDLADQKIDGHVARTRDRPLITGEVTRKEAKIIFVILCLFAATLLFFLNRLTIWLSFVGLLLAMLYPFSKRYIACPQVVLGAAYGWAVPMAFAAQTHTLPKVTWLIYSITLLWAIIYDTFYAMVDREDDLRIAVKSTAILFGAWDKKIIALLQCVMVLLLLALGYSQSFTLYYYLAIAIVMILFAYQHYLIRDRNPARCFQAFKNNQWVGLVVFLGLIA